MSLKVLLNNTIWLSLSHLLSRGALMLVGILLAKNLSIQDFALYSYFQMTIVLIASYASLGLGPTATKYFAELSTDEHNNDKKQIVSSLVVLSLILAVISALIIFVLPNDMLSSKFDISNALFALAVFIIVIGIVPLGAIQGLEKYKTMAYISIVDGIILFVGACLAIYYKSAYIAIYSLIISILFQAMLHSLTSYSGVVKLHINYAKSINLKAFKELSEFFGPLMIITILNTTSIYYIGRSILKIHGELYFSIFSIGLQWFSLALFVPGLVSRVILPRVIKQTTGIRKMLIYSSISAFLFSSVVFIVGLLMENTLIGLYGNKYSSYPYIIGYFLGISVFYAPVNTLSNALLAKIGSKYWLYITLIWFVVLMIIFNIMVEEFPILSIIYAHIVSSVVMLALTIYICKRKRIL